MLSSRVVEEGDATEEDADDEDGTVYTLCDLKISIPKQRNSLKLVNYKSAMP